MGKKDFLKKAIARDKEEHFIMINGSIQQDISQDISQVRPRLNKFMETEIISGIFYDHNGMKLEVNYKKKIEKHINMWRLSNLLLISG